MKIEWKQKKMFESIKVEANEVVIKQGDDGDNFYVIAEYVSFCICLVCICICVCNCTLILITKKKSILDYNEIH